MGGTLHRTDPDTRDEGTQLQGKSRVKIKSEEEEDISEKEEELTALIQQEKDRIEKLSWGERLIESPYWKGSGMVENWYQSSLVKLENQKQATSDTKGWRSVEERVQERHEQGRQEFRRVKRLINRGLYERENEPSHLTVIDEESTQSSSGDYAVAEEKGGEHRKSVEANREATGISCGTNGKMGGIHTGGQGTDPRPKVNACTEWRAARLGSSGTMSKSYHDPRAADKCVRICEEMDGRPDDTSRQAVKRESAASGRMDSSVCRTDPEDQGQIDQMKEDTQINHFSNDRHGGISTPDEEKRGKQQGTLTREEVCDMFMYRLKFMRDDLRIRSKSTSTQEMMEAVQERGNLIGEFRRIDRWATHPLRSLNRLDEQLTKDLNQVSLGWTKEVHGWTEDVVKVCLGRPIER
jgi:hypothetical protein